MKKRIFLNSVLFMLLISISVAWMITYASSGELTSYQRELIVPSINLDINMYKFVDGSYVEVTSSPLIINNFAPNDAIQFKFEITNNDEEDLTTDIVLADIEGDIDILGDNVSFISTTPYNFSIPLLSGLEPTNQGENIIRFFNNVSVAGNSTTVLYWQIFMSSRASNEVAGKSLVINSINFLQP